MLLSCDLTIVNYYCPISVFKCWFLAKLLRMNELEEGETTLSKKPWEKGMLDLDWSLRRACSFVAVKFFLFLSDLLLELLHDYSLDDAPGKLVFDCCLV